CPSIPCDGVLSTTWPRRRLVTSNLASSLYASCCMDMNDTAGRLVRTIQSVAVQNLSSFTLTTPLCLACSQLTNTPGSRGYRKASSPVCLSRLPTRFSDSRLSFLCLKLSGAHWAGL